MFKKPACLVIALEEHYWDDELEKTYTGTEAGRPSEQAARHVDWRGRPGWTQSADDADYYRRHPLSA